MGIRRLSILGVGLLGGSLGLAAKSRIKDCRVIGYGHRKETLAKAMQLGAIDESTSDLTEVVREADCVVLCTPVGLFESLLPQIAQIAQSGALKVGAIVTDVGSTKRSAVALATKYLSSPLAPTVHFVGSHPMAGSEKRGVEFARPDLFDSAVCITTPTDATDPAALETVEDLWRTVGMRIIRTTPEEHDRRVAMISHVPHAVAAALVAIQDQQTLALSGKGFTDATRIAAGDGVLWRDIFLDNADEVRAGLGRLRAQLDHLESLLRPEQSTQLKAWLDDIARKRQGMS